MTFLNVKKDLKASSDDLLEFINECSKIIECQCIILYLHQEMLKKTRNLAKYV